MKIAIVNMSALDDMEVGSMVAELMQKHEGLFERFGVEVVYVSKKMKEAPTDAQKLVIVEDESENPDWGEVICRKTLGVARIFSMSCMENGTAVGAQVEDQVLELMGDASVPDPGASVPDPGAERSRGDGEVASGDGAEGKRDVEVVQREREDGGPDRDVPVSGDVGGRKRRVRRAKAGGSPDGVRDEGRRDDRITTVKE